MEKRKIRRHGAQPALILILSLALTVGLAASALAQNKAPAGGGFTGPGPGAPATVAETLKMPDDSHVILTGRIERRLSEDMYLFKDATGETRVEIDAEDWGGVEAGPADTVELSGKVDKDLTGFKVEIHSVAKK